VMMKMRSVDIPVKKKKSIIKFQMLWHICFSSDDHLKFFGSSTFFSAIVMSIDM
jgi:hypothetical protein